MWQNKLPTPRFGFQDDVNFTTPTKSALKSGQFEDATPDNGNENATRMKTRQLRAVSLLGLSLCPQHTAFPTAVSVAPQVIEMPIFLLEERNSLVLKESRDTL